MAASLGAMPLPLQQALVGLLMGMQGKAGGGAHAGENVKPEDLTVRYAVGRECPGLLSISSLLIGSSTCIRTPSSPPSGP